MRSIPSSRIILECMTLLFVLLLFGCAQQPDPAGPPGDTAESVAGEGEASSTAGEFEDGFETGGTDRWEGKGNDDVTLEDDFESGDTQRWESEGEGVDRDSTKGDSGG